MLVVLEQLFVSWGEGRFVEGLQFAMVVILRYKVILERQFSCLKRSILLIWGHLLQSIQRISSFYLAVPGLSCGTWSAGFSHRMQTLSCGMWDVNPWPGIKPRPSALGAWSLSHWTIQGSPKVDVILLTSLDPCEAAPAFALPRLHFLFRGSSADPWLWMPTFCRWLQTTPSSGSSPCSYSPCFSSFHITYPTNSKSCPLCFQNVSWFLTLYMEHSSIPMRLFQCLQGLHSSIPAHLLSTLDIAEWWLQDWSQITSSASQVLLGLPYYTQERTQCAVKDSIRPTWPGLTCCFSPCSPWAPDFPNLPYTCSLRCVHLFSLPPSLPLPVFVPSSFTPRQSLHSVIFFQSLVLSLTRPPSSSINSLIASMVVKRYSCCSCLCIWHTFIPFCGWIIFHCVYVPHILCLFIY